MGWDAYREQTLARQKQLGILPEHTQLTPMLEGIQRWEELSTDERRLFARMVEVNAGFMEHTDAQIGRLVDALERTGQLDNTLLFVFIGDNGASGEGGLNGLFNEQSVTVGGKTVEQNLGRIDQLGLPGSYNHYPVGWAMAGNTPFQLCKQYTHLGGVRNPLVVHWPQGIETRGELRHQYHHVTDIVPTILEAIGVEAPAVINSVQQEPVEGYAMNHSFDHADAPTSHTTQYYEMLGNRGLYHDGWKVVTYHGRKPWENKAAWGFDEDHWELYNLNEDPSEANDLMKDRDRANLDDPMVKKTIELVGLWWAEAGKYQVLPLDDRFYTRALGREALYAGREFMTFYEGAVRIQPYEAPRPSTAPGRSAPRSRSPTVAPTAPSPPWAATRPAGRSASRARCRCSATTSPTPNTPTSAAATPSHPAGTWSALSSRRPAPSRWAPAAPVASSSPTPRSPKALSPAPAPSATRWTRPSTSAGTRAPPSPRTTVPTPSSPARSSGSTSTSTPTSTPTSPTTTSTTRATSPTPCFASKRSNYLSRTWEWWRGPRSESGGRA